MHAGLSNAFDDVRLIQAAEREVLEEVHRFSVRFIRLVDSRFFTEDFANVFEAFGDLCRCH